MGRLILIFTIALTACATTPIAKALPAPHVAIRLLPTASPTQQLSPTPVLVGSLIEPDLYLNAGPVHIPLELVIPALNVNAPMMAVGLTPENLMDAPKGAIGAAVWHSAFWYRGGGIPGDVGTATIAGHVNDPLGVPEIFANLSDLQPGDLIIIHLINSDLDVIFIVDQVQVYSIAESLNPAVLSRIFGAGPVAGQSAQPSLDGLSHLTLITCAGYIVDGEFDHHTVVYATRSD